MSISKIHLRKLLQLFYLPENQLTSELRSDIRNELNKKDLQGNGGADFYGPFWADAKSHVAEETDLVEASKFRIESNRNRRRLYPILTNGFLKWWLEKRRWSNQPFELFESNPKARYSFKDIDLTVKVENTLAAVMRDGSNRIVYPYFAEAPTLTKEAAQIGLWMMGEAMNDFDLDDMRILDVMRGNSYSIQDVPMEGNEEEVFRAHYSRILKKREKLRKEYP